MPQPDPQQKQPGEGVKQTAGVLTLLDGSMASPYRLALYMPGTFGTRAMGLETIIGVLVIYPLVVETCGRPASIEGVRLFVHGWQFLIVMAFVHGIAARLSSSLRHSYDIGKSWAKTAFGEFVLALGAALAAASVCQGVGVFIALGWLANLVQVALIRARFRRQAIHVHDAQFEAGVFKSHL